ncbi:intraflagellar transport-associated protein isoform X3 [Sardina pilchardus]|uniref:intraflagellar transport-associated protein isoform X3 n=1 Tax=Sardina pilchardus TaxID=27697 RepID=UPI002E0EFBE4
MVRPSAKSRMPGTTPPSGGGQQHDQAVAATLDLICSAPEQSYSQFLASFTQLNPETLRTEEPRDTRRNAGPEVTRDGRAGDGVANLRRRRDASDLPELSNSLDNAALRVEDNNDDLQGCSLLPGEVEERSLSTHTSSVIHSTQLEMSSTVNATHSISSQSGERVTHPTSELSGEQVDWEEVQPFHLDDNFDYDHVVLTHKYPTFPQNPAAN